MNSVSGGILFPYHACQSHEKDGAVEWLSTDTGYERLMPNYPSPLSLPQHPHQLLREASGGLLKGKS
jgi:hypothetical protein